MKQKQGVMQDGGYVIKVDNGNGKGFIGE